MGNIWIRIKYSVQSVQFSPSVVSKSLWPPWTAARQASLSIANCWSLLKLMSIESVMPSSHLILCHPFFSYLQSFPASGSLQMSQLFISGGQSIGFSFSISSSNEYSGLISFRIDWLDLLAVQGTLESSPTPQFKSINSSALSFLYSPTLTRLLEKPKLWLDGTLLAK